MGRTVYQSGNSWATSHDEAAVYVVDATTHEVLTQQAAIGRPSQLIIGSDGRIDVALGKWARIQVLDVLTGGSGATTTESRLLSVNA